MNQNNNWIEKFNELRKKPPTYDELLNFIQSERTTLLEDIKKEILDKSPTRKEVNHHTSYNEWKLDTIDGIISIINKYL